MTVPITLALCSNRADRIPEATERFRSVLGEQDRLLIIVDTAVDTHATWPFDPSVDCRVRVLHNGCNAGLSYSRNLAMKEAVSRYLVFLDDDITPTPDTIAALRTAFAEGIHVVGTRITADVQGHPEPWCLGPGQLHYLGCHAPGRPATIWGGCFGLDLDQVRLLGATFDERLGRRGRSLISAEDTTFVRALVARGALASVLDDVEVTHQIAASRLRLRYLLRRAYGQGRSEARRGTPREGLAKEWRRNLGDSRRDPRQTAYALLYTSAVFLGVTREMAEDRMLAGRAG